jgi:O-antigen ligase
MPHEILLDSSFGKGWNVLRVQLYSTSAVFAQHPHMETCLSFTTFDRPRLDLRDPVTAARILLLAALLAILVSPPAVNLLEGTLLLVAIFSREIRSRLFLVIRQPMVACAMVFGLIVIIAATYSVAPHEDAWRSAFGWRKILLIPLGAALFNDVRWKAHVVHWLVGTVIVWTLASFGSWMTGITIPGSPPGILVRNHATQGMMFALATFCIALLLRRGWHTLPQHMRTGLLAGLILLLLNIVFVTPGRSGYVVLLVLAGTLPLCWARSGPKRSHFLVAILLVVLLGITLAITPTTRDRIMQGVHEMQNYQHDPQLTSMGIRVVMLQHTRTLLMERPLLGYGTGSFLTAYHELVKDKSGWQAVDVGDPHNQFLKIWAEQGMAGLLAFLAFLVAAIKQRGVSTPYRALGIGAMVAWCATSMTSSHFSTFAEGHFILAWMGIMLASESEQLGKCHASSGKHRPM